MDKSTEVLNVRRFARTLGLQYDSNQGRLKFGKAAHVQELWRKAMRAALPYSGKYSRIVQNILPFQHVENLIDEYGERVWGRSNRSWLFVAGEHKEYPNDLYWPDHREQ